MAWRARRAFWGGSLGVNVEGDGGLPGSTVLRELPATITKQQQQ